MRRSTFLFFISFLLFFPPYAGADSISRKQQKNLIHMLKHDCGSCHGITLKGGLGPPLTPEALEGKPLEYLTYIITNGQPDRAMPPWGVLLSPEEIAWLAKKLQSGVTP
ncbi:MAG: cytochrome c [Magnetococcales bacterium]|nr:cytochrome c [Magnetococcales bacterium]